MKKLILKGGLTMFLLVAAAFQASAQRPPSEAQIRKDVMNPGVIAIVFRGSGSYEKYVTNGAVVTEYYRSITVRRKTERAGVTLDVLGDVVYRLVGGRWVYRTMRLAANQYSGFKNPSVDDINQALENANYRSFHGNGAVIEYESVVIAPAPNWEWHTPNSVSFYAIAVYRVLSNGKSYANGGAAQYRQGFETIDRVREVWRVRIYRKDEKSPWNNGTLTTVGQLEIPDGKGGAIERDYLIDRRQYPTGEVRQMPRADKVPLFTN